MSRAAGCAALIVALFAVTLARRAAHTSVSESKESVLRVSGSDSAAPSALKPTLPIAPERTDPAPERAPLSGAEIARRASNIAAFIQANGVYGGGILLDAHGHLLTCLHVVEGQTRAQVAFRDTQPVTATVVDTDRSLDLALLAVTTDRVPAVPLGTVVGTAMGDTVFTMGAPHRMQFSLSRGLVSFVDRRFDEIYYLQTDLPMNAGSSGGPVLNDRGELVAIASFVIRDSEGISFALPIDYAYRRFAERLDGTVPKDHGAFERWLASAEQ